MRKLLFACLAIFAGRAMAQQIEIGIPIGHQYGIQGIVESPDRSCLATFSSGEKECIIWSAKEGKVLHRLAGHKNTISSCVFLNDTLVVTASDDSTVKVWNLQNGNSFEFDQKIVTPVVFRLKNGRFLMAGEEILVYVQCQFHEKMDKTKAEVKNENQLGVDFRIEKKIAHSFVNFRIGSVQHDSFFVWSYSLSSGKRRFQVYNLETGKKVNEYTLKRGIKSYWENPICFLNSDGQRWIEVNGNKTHIFRSQGKPLEIVSKDSTSIKDAKLDKEQNRLAILTAKRLLILNAKDGATLQEFVWKGVPSYSSVYQRLNWDPSGRIVYLTESYPCKTAALFLDSGTFQAIGENSTIQPSDGVCYYGDYAGNMSRFYTKTGQVKPFAEMTKQVISTAYWSKKDFEILLGYENKVNVFGFRDGSFKKSIDILLNSTPLYDTVSSTLYFLDPDNQIFSRKSGGDPVRILQGVSSSSLMDMKLTSDGRYLVLNLSSEEVFIDGDSPSLADKNGFYGQYSRLEFYDTRTLELAATILDSNNINFNLSEIALIDTPYHGLAIYRENEYGTEILIYSYLYNSQPLYRFQTKLYIDPTLFKFDVDGHTLMVATRRSGLKFLSIQGEELGSVDGFVRGAITSPDRSKLCIVSDYYGLSVFDLQSNKRGASFQIQGYITEARFFDDGKKIMYRKDDNSIFIITADSGKILASFDKVNGFILLAELLENGELLTITSEGVVSFWDPANAQWKMQSFLMEGGEAITLLQGGLFDANTRLFDEMYWVRGMEIIEFKQLKERYWEPGLWEKYLLRKPIRDVEKMHGLRMQPLLELGNPDGYKIPVRLVKRDGGYGKIVVFINGKEVIADARGNGFDTSKAEQTIWVNVEGSPYLKDGSENTITIKTWGADGFVSSKGENIVLKPNKRNSDVKPSMYAIVCGISEYANGSMNLKYSVTDAKAIEHAVSLAAGNLFTRDSIHFYTLTSENGRTPNKKNIKNVFDSIGRSARAEDVIMVYLSGHGVTAGGDGGDFYYLTSDAFSSSGEAYTDPQIRQNTTISSAEFIEWMNSIHASKQFMVIDACGSGKAVENLIAKRSVDASQIKAIDRMRDRTGMHIISGCAADAVSYEASMYGQGLLTYSLLEAMKGGALRQEKYLDVNAMMQHALERVPALANDIGGIQKPQVLSPQGAQSFDLGILEKEDQQKIVLSQPKPVFVRSRVFTEELDDPMNLNAAINAMLDDMANPQKENNLVFFDAFEFPDAWIVRGFYRKEGEMIVLDAVFKHNETTIKKQITGKSALEVTRKLRQELAAQI